MLLHSMETITLEAWEEQGVLLVVDFGAGDIHESACMHSLGSKVLIFPFYRLKSIHSLYVRLPVYL